MKLEFYYWSYQCPLNYDMLRLLEEYGDRLDIVCRDITGKPELAKEHRMFYPTLTVVEGRFRYFSPLRREFLEELCRGRLPQGRPYRPRLSAREYAAEIVPLTPETVALAAGCTGGTCERACKAKLRFWKEAAGEPLGFLHIRGEELLGGAEYLPASRVPYDIPKQEDTAFLTCLYCSDEVYDYKSAPLHVLEKYLAGKYRRILAISDEKGVFPNGDLDFFLRNGYRDAGVIVREPGYCTLHLVEKFIIS